MARKRGRMGRGKERGRLAPARPSLKITHKEARDLLNNKQALVKKARELGVRESELKLALNRILSNKK